MTPRPRRPSRILANLVVALPLVAGLAIFAWAQLFPGDFRQLAASDLVSVREGGPVPIVELQDSAGETVSLPSLVGPRGAAVMVVDPGSPNSRSQLADLSALSAGGGAENLPVVLVSVGAQEANAQLRARFPGMTLYDDANGVFGARYGLRGTPVLLVADGDRRVRAVLGGRLSRDELLGALRSPGGGAR